MIWLKSIRETKNMTQKDVATSTGLTQPTYCNIENGARKPSVPTAKAIANVLGFDWTQFFADEDMPHGSA